MSRVPWALLFSLVLLGAFEVFLRTRDPRDGLIFAANDQSIAPVVRDVIDADEAPDVAFVGSSMTYRGVSPTDLVEQLTQRLGRPVRVANYAILGAEIATFEKVVRRLLDDPKGKPKVIVVGVGMRDLRGGPPDVQSLAPFWSWSDFRDDINVEGLSAAAERLPFIARNVIDHHCWMLRYRIGIAAWIGQHFYPIDADAMPSLGERTKRHKGVQAYKAMSLKQFREPKFQQTVRERYTRRPIPDDVALRDAYTLAREAKASGVPTLYLDIPVAPPLDKLIASIDAQSKHYDEKYRAAMRTLSADTGIPFIELDRKRFGLPDFVDSQHLNYLGAQKVDAMIVERLAVLLGEKPGRKKRRPTTATTTSS